MKADHHSGIRAVSDQRVGWDEAFKAMATRGDDALLDDIPTSEWDDTEWEW